MRPCELGCRDSWHQALDIDSSLEFKCDCFCEEVEISFGCAVGGVASHRAETTDGGNVDNGALVLSCKELGNHFLGQHSGW